MTARFAHAVVRFTDQSEGGRIQGIRPGYRSIFRFEGASVDFGGEVQFDADVLPPGEDAKVAIRFWASAALPEPLEGRHFEVREGHRVVGYGTVLG